MSDGPTSSVEGKKQRFPIWALMPIGLLGMSMTLVIAMVTVSANDPGFAVEPDYYKKAVDWDSFQAQQAANAALGWTLNWRFERDPAATAAGDRRVEVTVQLTDRGAKPIPTARLELSAFSNARAASVESISLSEQAPGVYSGAFELHRPGLWEFRLNAEQGGSTFTRQLKTEFLSASFSTPKVVQ